MSILSRACRRALAHSLATASTAATTASATAAATANTVAASVASSAPRAFQSVSAVFISSSSCSHSNSNAATNSALGSIPKNNSISSRTATHSVATQGAARAFSGPALNSDYVNNLPPTDSFPHLDDSFSSSSAAAAEGNGDDSADVGGNNSGSGGDGDANSTPYSRMQDATAFAEQLVAQQPAGVMDSLISPPAATAEEASAEVDLLDRRTALEIAQVVDELQTLVVPPRDKPTLASLYSARSALILTKDVADQSSAFAIDSAVRSAVAMHVLLHLGRRSEAAAYAIAAADKAVAELPEGASETAIEAARQRGYDSVALAPGTPPPFQVVRLDERTLHTEIDAALVHFTGKSEHVDFTSTPYLLAAADAAIRHIDTVIDTAQRESAAVMAKLEYKDELLRSMFTKEQIAREYRQYAIETGTHPEPRLFEQQLINETLAVSAAVLKYRELSQELSRMGRGSSLKPAQQFVMAWFEPLSRAIQHEQALVENKVVGEGRKVYGPYIQALGASELACVVMHELLNRLLVSPGGVRFIEAAVAVGRAVNAEVNMQFIKGNKEAYDELRRQLPMGQRTTDSVMIKARKFMSNSVWSDQVRAQVGACLLKIMMNTVTIRMDNQKKGKAAAHNNMKEVAPTMAALLLDNNMSPIDRAARKYVENMQHTALVSGAASADSSNGLAATNAAASSTALEINDKPGNAQLAVVAAELAAQAIADKVQYHAESGPATSIVPQEELAFLHEYVPVKKGHYIGVIRCHRDVLTMIEEGHAFIAGLGPKLMPMVVPPRPWSSPKAGGYITVQNTAIRAKGSAKQLQAVFYADMPAAFESLDVLGRVPWRVNKQVIDVVKAFWEKGGGVADLPGRVDIPLPLPLAAPVLDEMNTAEENERVQRAYNREMRKHNKLIQKLTQANMDLHSLRCDVILKLNQADALMDYELYFPCNMDFRGRAYPLPPHLNHLGSDMSRGILMFSEKRPLGERGLYWLYAHLAAQFGVDKISFDDRVAYAKSHLDKILQAADDPLFASMPNPRFGKTRGELDPPQEHSEFIPWWMTADSPWQALATCFEIAAAVRSPNPAEYCCSLPVHQDGSCNGLQHYAALGRDELGGARVNLMPADKPQDVYSHVLAQVKVLMDEDRANGHPLAELLLPHITRKVVKQTVMTSVYGVTFVGAREQVMRQLVDLREINWPDPKERALYQASMYIARLTLNSLSTVFTGAKSIMGWLGECASLMAREQQPVSWVTPLGLPVTQPYRKNSAYTIRTLMQNVTMTDNNDSLPVSVTRQKAAFPPNFVHSLDATHMMTTAIECEKKGLNFSSVHDSFWAHACDVDTMNTVLREQFIQLYSQPILDDLHTSFSIRFPHVQFPPVPKRGTLDLNKIRESKYFFS